MGEHGPSRFQTEGEKKSTFLGKGGAIQGRLASVSNQRTNTVAKATSSETGQGGGKKGRKLLCIVNIGEGDVRNTKSESFGSFDSGKGGISYELKKGGVARPAARNVNGEINVKSFAAL